MKSWPDKSGRFRERLYFDDNEFDQMMNEARAKAGSDVFNEGAGIDVDRVLMKAFGIEADYVDLPVGVLGRTVFDSMGQARVELSRYLDEAASNDKLARRRLRTTLAHEVGHVACHPTLFIEDTVTLSLFPEDDTNKGEGILCREVSIGNYNEKRYRGEWWEYQANQCMASLLLPRELFNDKVRTAIESVDVGSFDDAVRSGNGEKVVTSLANCFDVSQEVVLYRLRELGYVNNPQRRLL